MNRNIAPLPGKGRSFCPLPKNGGRKRRFSCFKELLQQKEFQKLVDCPYCKEYCEITLEEQQFPPTGVHRGAQEKLIETDTPPGSKKSTRKNCWKRSIQQESQIRINFQATHDTIRFPNQFTTDFGDYTQERRTPQN